MYILKTTIKNTLLYYTKTTLICLNYYSLLYHTTRGFPTSCALINHIYISQFVILVYSESRMWLLKDSNKPVSQSCAEPTSAAPNRGLPSHAPVNMADSMGEAKVGGKTQEMARLLRCTALSYAKFSQTLEVLRDFHHLFGSRNSPTTGMFTGACGPPEKESLALVPR